MPKVSILMSVFNAQRYLEQAIKNILNQSLSDFEFIIIEDASTDGTYEILKDFRKKDKRIKILRNKKRLGLTVSLNKGLRKARGEFIARMDADDISNKNRLKIQSNFLKKNPEVAFCGSWVTLINQSGKKIGEKKYPLEYGQIKKVILKYNPFVHPSVMIRRKVLEERGFYDSNLNGAEDYDLFLRIAKNHQAVNLPCFLLKYRINPQGVSFLQYKKTERQALKARWKAIREYGYPYWQIIYLIKPLISYLVPFKIKRFFLKNQ